MTEACHVPQITQLTALDLALRSPKVLPATATVAEVRAFYADSDHVHLALLVDATGVLVSAVSAVDLSPELPGEVPAVMVGRLTGRTVHATVDETGVSDMLQRGGMRRLAVVDDDGRLLGLICRKRSGRGYCTDAGVRQRRQG